MILNFVFLKKLYLFLMVRHVRVGVWERVLDCSTQGDQGQWILWNCELPGVSAGNWAWVLWKSRMYTAPLSHLSSSIMRKALSNLRWCVPPQTNREHVIAVCLPPCAWHYLASQVIQLLSCKHWVIQFGARLFCNYMFFVFFFLPPCSLITKLE